MDNIDDIFRQIVIGSQWRYASKWMVNQVTSLAKERLPHNLDGFTVQDVFPGDYALGLHVSYKGGLYFAIDTPAHADRIGKVFNSDLHLDAWQPRPTVTSSPILGWTKMSIARGLLAYVPIAQRPNVVAQVMAHSSLCAIFAELDWFTIDASLSAPQPQREVFARFKDGLMVFLHVNGIDPGTGDSLGDFIQKSSRLGCRTKKPLRLHGRKDDLVALCRSVAFHANKHGDAGTRGRFEEYAEYFTGEPEVDFIPPELTVTLVEQK